MANTWEFGIRDKNKVMSDFADNSTGHRHDGTDSRILSSNSYATASFDVSSGHNHNGTNGKYVPYHVHKAGIQSSAEGSTISVAVAAMAATDVILATLITSGTTGYVVSAKQTSTAAFLVTMSADVGAATISYAVFKNA